MLLLNDVPNINNLLKTNKLISYLKDINETEFCVRGGSLIYNIDDIDDELIFFLKKFLSSKTLLERILLQQ